MHASWVPIFTKYDQLNNIDYIVAGQEHVISLTKDKKVFAHGYNAHGQVRIDELV